MKIFLSLMCLSFFMNLSLAASPPARDPRVGATYKDIKETLGIVPAYLKDYPQEAIVGAWADLKNLQLNPKTALDGKTKELIGLAVAAQIPCRLWT